MLLPSKSTKAKCFLWMCLCLLLLLGTWITPACGPQSGKEKSQEQGTEPQQDQQPADSSTEVIPDDRNPDAKPTDRTSPDNPPDQPPPLTCDTPFTWPVEKKSVTVAPAADVWKSTLQMPNDSFMGAAGETSPRWAKFTILLEDPTKVYFQNSRKHLYHYDFVTQHLGPYKGIKRNEFDNIALRKASQKLVVGAVILSPGFQPKAEYGIAFERQEAYHPEMLKVLYDLVKSSLKFQDPMKDFYFPSFHQKESAKALVGCLAKKGLEVSSIGRWLTGNQCYSGGWALGRLVHIPGNAIDRAYKDGRLKPTDILLTDAVPSEIPHVAGVITMTPTTPNSHVVILAQTFRVPFAYPRLQIEAIKALVDKEVLLRVKSFGCQIDVVDMTGRLDAKSRKLLLDDKKPPALKITAKQTKGNLHQSTDGLTPQDIRYFGGKASNFGLLRKAIPDNSPISIAFSFDLWDQFMGQTMKSGKTLRAEIHALLKDFTYPPNMSQLQTALQTIRDKIKDDTSFTADQQTAIKAALKPFTEDKKIRFRSSTNVEDSAVFTGAGLYDSYSGCLADDQDKDDKGPSLCDASKPKERGVFRAIRKVFASFYNANAFLERLRFGIDENKVGMALLAHHSFPDPDELANGVASLQKQSADSYQITMVSQLGANSVANPDNNAQPEIMVGSKFSRSELFLRRQQGSSLVPLGGSVMTAPDDYKALAALLLKVAQAFEQANPGLTTYTLDLEYKKIKPGKLIVKQVRQIPQPNNKRTLTPFFTGAPLKMCVFQGEYADVFANARLKSTWTIIPKSIELSEENRKSSLFQQIEVSFISDGKPKTVKGTPDSLPGAAHTTKDEEIGDSFTDGSGAQARTFTLLAQIPKQLSARETRILLARDMIWYVKGTYTTPVPHIDHTQQHKTRTEDFVRLSTDCLDTKTKPDELLQERTLKGPNGVQVKTSYYWPPAPTGVTAGYTAPLVRWVKTEITGLTSKPIVLTNYYSQTYRPAHHNFGEWFLFTPALADNPDKTQQDELKAKNIASIYVEGAHRNSSPAKFKYIGTDGKLRDP